jgi:hypothetical protein
MADARMDYKAPIEPKDVDAIVHYLISIGGANQAGGSSACSRREAPADNAPSPSSIN